MVSSVRDLSELLAYEELEDPVDEECMAVYESEDYHRRILGMHNYIPCKPFKATIRVHRSVPSSYIQALRTPSVLGSRGTVGAELISTSACCTEDYIGIDSPASFPGTPFARANLLSKTSDRVVSVMFGARDRLRQEAQSVSRDEFSRMQANEAILSGQYACFDPKQSNSSIALSCGNHCAMKVGKGLCCCCRSMMPIRTNTYVYLEFSIMVSSAQKPSLGIGLAPEASPLNVMVGQWPGSKGLYGDGQVLIGSRWYQPKNNLRIEAGSTVGMLVYLPWTNPAPSQCNTGAEAANLDLGSSSTDLIYSPVLRMRKSSDIVLRRLHSPIAEGTDETNVSASVNSLVNLSGVHEAPSNQSFYQQMLTALSRGATPENLAGQEPPGPPQDPSTLQSISEEDFEGAVGLELNSRENSTLDSSFESPTSSIKSSPKRRNKSITGKSADVINPGHMTEDDSSLSSIEKQSSQESVSSEPAPCEPDQSRKPVTMQFTINGERIHHLDQEANYELLTGATSVPGSVGGADSREPNSSDSSALPGSSSRSASRSGVPENSPFSTDSSNKQKGPTDPPVLFPMVSLFTDDTRVWCRFCEADVVYRSRQAIGAPPGVRVYCLDGTLLLNEDG